ncbi:unnamed protein product [Ambrosiozyma monospora]|uniref:Unnamed protein product n=1 Tax=Ambrosiozyma monospora TaxID=43982 RepID=A0ACB5SUM8_AMBMO|nr:unnamed protein product [Ambrosiozyma monospora]
MPSWTPLPKLLMGRVIKPFIPFKPDQQVDESIRQNFLQMDPGNVVCLFETESSENKWARGYMAWLAMPSDFSSANVSMEVLPEYHLEVCIMPWSHIQVLGEEELVFSGGDYTGILSDDVYVNMDSSSDESSLASSITGKRHKRPVVPIFESIMYYKGLENEIELQLRDTCVQIYALFSRGDLENSKALFTVFKDLVRIRAGIVNGVDTISEMKVSKRKAIKLLSTVPKVIAASNNKLAQRSHFRSKDVSGYQIIFARDTDTGELYSYNTENAKDTMANLPRLANNQLFTALSAKFPVEDANIPLFPSRNTKFDPAPPSHVLIDLHAVIGSCKAIPKGYCGMTAYLYLRNQKKRLTEGYAIKIEPGQFISLDNMAAAMFVNIPAIEIDAGRIYLVAIITETLEVPEVAPIKNGVPSLKTIRRGICAGVTDVSRIFARKKSHLSSDMSHDMTMKLYASYMTRSSEDVDVYPGMNLMKAMGALSMENNGWGELIDRIISGSNKGVAVNPRAEELMLSIKEVNQESFTAGVGTFKAIDLVKTVAYNPLEQAYCRIYLRVIKCHGPEETTKRFNREANYATVEVTASSKLLKFSKGSNETPLSRWQFISTAPEETIGEFIQVTGLSVTPTNDNDFLYFDVFSGGQFFGSGKYPLRVYNQISDGGFSDKKSKSIDLFAPGSATPVGSVEIELQYTGKNYNVDPYVEMVLNWKTIFEPNIQSTDKNLISTLGKLKRTPLSTIIKFFPELMKSVLDIYSMANEKHEVLSAYGSARETKFQSISDATFECIVQLLDVTIARQDQYVYLFDKLLERILPAVGEYLVNDTTRCLSTFETDRWGSVGRAICRITPLILRVAAASVGDSVSFVSATNKLAEFISSFLASKNELLVSDQLIMIENLELVLEAVRDTFDDIQLVKYVGSWSDAMGFKGLCILEDENANALVNKKKNKQHRFIIEKLLFLNRTVRSFLVDTESKQAREDLLCNAIYGACYVLLHDEIDIDASRLALGVMASVVNVSLGPEKRFFDESFELYIALCSTGPQIVDGFNKYLKFCKENGMVTSKRYFTQLFPTTYPFPQFTVDPLVDEEAFCEILMEYQVVNMMLMQVTEITHDRISRMLAGVEPFPTSYSKLDSIILSIEESTANGTHTGVFQAYLEMVEPTFYPGSRWITLKSYFVMLLGSYTQNYTDTVLALFANEQALKDPALVAFASTFFLSYLVSLL